MTAQAHTQSRSIWDPAIVQTAIVDATRKLHPRTMARNPVMFVVEVGSVLTTLRLLVDATTNRPGLGFELQITFWLWLTVLFANFAEAMAEGRGKAQADTLRKARTETVANRIGAGGKVDIVPATSLRMDDVVMVKAGEFIPSDGEIIEGVASVDESAITGESAPVIRESGGDRSSVTPFSIANDVAKYFAIIPAMFAAAFPVLMTLNVMGLRTPQSAILSAVIFNALIIVALVPLALRGIRYRAMSAEALLRRNLLIYGAGGIVVPFIGIKIIDVIITALRLA
jgi:high-affinity K+ transport system ATPase subunit B